jgi:hypothetical protein
MRPNIVLYDANNRRIARRSTPEVSRRVSSSGIALLGPSILSGEHIGDWKWPASVKLAMKMYRSDAKISAIIRVLTLPIMRANWHIAGGMVGKRPTPEREFAEAFCFKLPKRSWQEYVRRITTGEFVCGHSVFEEVYATDGQTVWLDDLAEIIQSSVSEWNHSDTNEFTGITQLGWWGKTMRTQFIPADRLAVFTFNQQGDDPTGMPLTRHMHQHWWYKSNGYKFDGMLQDRYAVPPLTGTLAEGDSEDEQVAMEEVLEASRSGEKSYMVLANGQTVAAEGLEGTLPNPLDSAKHHDEQMSKAALAAFLDFGTTETGARASSETARDMMITSLQAEADEVGASFNRQVLHPALDRNFGPGAWPDDIGIGPGDMQNLDIEYLALPLSQLVAAGLLTPDPALESYIRAMQRLPLRIDMGMTAPSQRSANPPREASSSGDEEVKVAASRRRRGSRGGKKHAHVCSIGGMNREAVDSELFVNFRGADERMASQSALFIADVAPTRDAYIEEIIAAALALDPPTLRESGPDMPDAFVSLLIAHLVDSAGFGAAEVAREAREQIGRPGVVPRLGDGLGIAPYRPEAPIWTDMQQLEEYLDELATMIGLDEQDRLLREAARVILLSPSGADESTLRAVLAANLAGMSIDVLRSSAERAIDSAYAEGRHLGAETQRIAGRVPQRAMYSALRDRNVCGPCKALDRKYHAPFDFAFITPNPNCQGGDRCRCITVYEF